MKCCSTWTTYITHAIENRQKFTKVQYTLYRKIEMSKMTQNSMFDRGGSRADIEKSTEKIVKAVGEMGKDSRKMVDAVKTGSEKIVDSINKVKIGNSANQSTPTVPSAVSKGLRSVAESTAQLAGHLHSNPSEIGAVADSASGIQKQFKDLVECAEQYAQSTNDLMAAAHETTQSSNWIGGQYGGGGGVSVNNSFGRVVGSFQDL